MAKMGLIKMVDVIGEELVRKEKTTSRRSLEVASKVTSSPDHPRYSADRAVAITMLDGKGGLVAAIDGFGSGGERSVEAADSVQRSLMGIKESLVAVPTVNQGVEKLKQAIFQSTGEIKKLHVQPGDKERIGATVSAGLVCESPDGSKRFLLTANAGDSRLYRYRPRTGEVDQLTRDNSYARYLLDAGMIEEDELFGHPAGSVLSKSVGSLSEPEHIDFEVYEIQDGDIFIGVSDGISDNLTPDGLPYAFREDFRGAYDQITGRLDLKKMAESITERARRIMAKGDEIQHAKKDDTCVAILRAPRSSGLK